MRARTHLIRLQRTLYDRLKEYGRELLGGLSPELKKYFEEYQKDFQDFKEVSTKRELLSALQKTHVAFCGDYHTLAQAQRTVIRLLRDSLKGLQQRKRKLVLALEMVRARDNPLIERFLAGDLSEKAFLEAISFSRNWGFSWQNYRGIFQFAREHGLPIVGLNLSRKSKPPSLQQRDRYAARVIADLTAADDKTLVMVLMGDLHLAQAHLPRHLRRQLKERALDRKLLIIHQNNERFYWKLVARGLEQRVDVVKVKEGVYCVMNTPPWVKLQSHLKWAEMISEGGDLPLSDETSEVLMEIDHSEEVRELILIIQTFIGWDRALQDDFAVVHFADRHLLRRLGEHGYSAFARKVVARCLREFNSFFIPGLNVFYLADDSLNHAATQAAIYLHCTVSGNRRIFSEPARDFYPFVWVEALGFVGSKILNHKRKCGGPRDWERMVQTGTGKNVDVAEAAWLHWQAEMKPTQPFSGIRLPARTARPQRAVFYYKVAKLLGRLLGHALYTAVVDNQVTRAELGALFGHRFRSGPEARQLYLTWIQRLDQGGYRQFNKTERL